jgi:probable F420-dependent oxidoreductase
MLELARDRTAGAHPNFVPAEHTARARAALGPRPLLAPEHAFVLEDDADRARVVGRQYAKAYLRRTNPTNSLRDLGYTDEDFADDGSDRLIDVVVAWGDVETIVRKLRAHLDAGADHVCLQPLGPIETAADQLAAIAPARGVSPA